MVFLCISLFGLEVTNGHIDKVEKLLPLYNGNISETQWRTANTDSSLKYYSYAYDALNRITGAEDNTQKFTVSGITYDKNGNLLSLTRMGPKSTTPVLNDTDDTDYGIMDVLDYAYHENEMSNRLYKVRDDGEDAFGFKDGATDVQDYWYDANGNLTQDLNKGIQADGITYNHLNLPTQVSLNSGTFDYIYDATGIKLKKIVSTGNNTEYAGNYIYENGDLQFFSTPEGYVEPNTTGGYDYIYQYKDHLGNIRLSYKNVGTSSNVDLEIQEENNYYPFGLEHKGYNNQINGRENKYQTYQSKELQEDLGLNWHDFGARQYDAAIGRWTSIDPLAKDYMDYSPYTAVINNPIMFIDPDGRAAFSPIYDPDGNLLGTDDQGLQGKAIVMNAENFEQGMSHEDALSNNLGAEGLNIKEAETKLLDSYNSLSERPDYDGELTLSEANEWFREGEGSPLYVDSAKIDLSPVETSDFGDKDSMFYNFFTDGQGDYTTGRVYGTIKLSLTDENGTVKLGGSNGHLDTYDFDIKENKSNNFKVGLRNFGTRVGKALAGKGTAYKIFTYGTGQVEKSKK